VSRRRSIKMAETSPTRSELLARRAQISLASQGAELLRSKREALVREFLKELQAFAAARRAMHQTLIEAIQCLMEALAVDGPEAVSSAAFTSLRQFGLEVEPQNIWGTKVVDIKSSYTVRSAGQRGYTPLGVTGRIDEAAERFEQAVAMIIEIAPADLKLRALAKDIRKTSRRVNALEQRLLPNLNEQVKFICNALDQREREDIFRLKRLKQSGAAGR
jgi:V/A-type H+-transporting ATPase subunit D